MEERIFYEEIVSIIRENISPLAMKEKLMQYHENDIALSLPELNEKERELLFSLLDNETLSSVIEYSDENRNKYLEEIGVKRRIKILEKIETDYASSYLSSIPHGERVMITEFLDENSKDELRMLSSFTDDEIGSVMSTNYIHLDYKMSIKEAMKSLQEQSEENDNIQTLFVTKEDDIYYGAIDLKDLIRARENNTLSSIITTSFPYVYGNDLIEEELNKLKEYREDSIPVLNKDGKLLGAITSQMVVRLIGESGEEDYAKFAQLGGSEDLKERVMDGIKKRLPWLLLLLLLSIVVSSLIGLYEEVISGLVILMAFQSLVLDMSGNSGTQSLSVTIRILNSKKLTKKENLKLVGKEIKTGLLNGTLLAFLAFIVETFYICFIKKNEIYFSLSVSLVIGISLLLSMTLSSFFGSLIPILLNKIHIDPAVASGPLITTLNDALGAIIYYSLSLLILIKILHFC